MKDNNIKGDQEFEKKLREKMNELSSGVDCFDKISARAFPEKDSDFSESEYTVSDLENVTGRRRAVPVLKWIAAAAAVIICIGILPHTTFVQNFMSNFRRSGDERYLGLLTEIFEETEKHTYEIYDMSLKEYVETDVLVDPLYRCPFKYNDKEGIRVRFFVRKVSDNILTNQVYAVEYKGDFDRSSVLAAAKSKAEFTDKDIKSAEKYVFGNCNEAAYAANAAFSSGKGGTLSYNGIKVTVASYTYDRLFKDDEGVRPVDTQVLYCFSKDTGKYGYDLINTVYNAETETIYEVRLSDDLWKCSINYDGSDAMPDTSDSCFEKKGFFAERANNTEYSQSCFSPFEIADADLVRQGSDELSSGGSLSIDTKSPVGIDAKHSMRIYIGIGNYFIFSSESDPKINLSLNGGSDIITVHGRDVSILSTEDAGISTMTEVEVSTQYTEDETDDLEEFRKRAEMAADNYYFENAQNQFETTIDIDDFQEFTWVPSDYTN